MSGHRFEARTGRGRARQLANLRPAPPAPAGNQRPRTHGGYSVVTDAERDAKVREVFAALSADAPLRGPDGALPAADRMVVHLLARCLVRLERVEADLADHGWRDRETGEPRPAVDLEARLRREALELARELGMTPRARAALGLDLQRGFNLADAMALDADAEAAEQEGGRG